MESIAKTTGDTQALAKQAVEQHFIRPIAEALYRADRKNHTAMLATLDPVSQQQYLRDAALVFYLHDQPRLRAAFYDGADSLVDGALGAMPRWVRGFLVQKFGLAFDIVRKSLYGERETQRARYAELAEADEQDTAAAKLSQDAAALRHAPTPGKVM